MRIPTSITRLLRKHSPTPKQLSELSGLSIPGSTRLVNIGFQGTINDGTLAYLQKAVNKLESGEFKSVLHNKAPRVYKPRATPILVFSKNNTFLGVTSPKPIKDMPGVLVIKLDD